ncbi:carboxymuconolactone decarboxylase family protein [Ornithinimicrobium tianjinense]|uniref:Carboxymuconolactone decarboxylase-like domain-containing protein n=1 Tax=Ornithinimicrobium tianjinense TaxID=1195761 RepID=A0A917BRV2_9MICO|nr:carboxymuconolactone decarboxylase family protein [Ornithinimicrobium tianjinense]GGF53710.1 hypothetical protein GCM10011366_21950 [Ornithinimicrobium tianjinense]
MTSTLRIPAAELTGPTGALLRTMAQRMFGRIPDNLSVLFHHRPVLWAIFGYELKVARWKELDPHLKKYAEMAAAGAIGCSWCLDYGYYVAHTDGLDLAKVREVPRWRESSVFTPLERDVMEYAEAVTATPPTVTDEMVTRLDEALGHAALVELTAMIAVENHRSRLNAAMGLTSQGFSAVCELPLAQASSNAPARD